MISRDFVIPVIRDLSVYVPVSAAMLNMIRRDMRPAIMHLVDSLTDPKDREALGVIRHCQLEICSILEQIADVERAAPIVAVNDTTRIPLDFDSLQNMRREPQKH